MSQITIKELSADERPRERSLRHGAECLSTRELLAVIIGSGPRAKGCLGLAEDLFKRGILPSKVDLEDEQFFASLDTDGSLLLTDIKGLGLATKARLLALFEFSKRFARYRESKTRGRLRYSPTKLKRQAQKRLSESLRSSAKEWIGFVPIYSSNRVGDFCVIEFGTRFHVNFDPKNLFSKLFTLNAVAFFLMHNHPSGALEPSAADHLLTQQIQILGKQLNTYLIDHCVVSSKGFSWVSEEISGWPDSN